MIPVVDLADPHAGRALDTGLRELGFVRLRNHQLDTDTAANYRSVSDAFFALSSSEKLRYVHPNALANRGFRAKGSETLSYSLGKPTPPDLFESFNAGDPAVVIDAHPLVAATPWPDDLIPGFSKAAGSLANEFRSLCTHMESLIESVTGFGSTGSGLRADMMACIDYRPDASGSEAVVDGQQRMGAHSDYTAFTLLLADPVPGLQIVTSNGEWIDVIPEPGELLFNVGDLLAIATNDVWPSTLHRVVPMAAGAAATRRSVAYFRYPPLSQVISPLPSFTSTELPARYDSVSVEEHLIGKLASPKLRQLPTSALTDDGRV